jgi:PilZ domain
MPSSPEKAEQQGPAKRQADVVTGGQPELGLRLEARVKAPTWEVGLPAIIQDFAPGEVILVLNDSIAAGTHVSVQVNTCSFDGEILFCKPRGGRWEAHVSFDDVDAIGMRRTPRFPVRIPARIFAATSEVPVEGMIVDVSGEGLGIELAQPVALEAGIAVQSEENIALGEVRHCRQISAGLFRAGVRLHHIIKKDPDLEKAAAESGWMGWLGARMGRKK